MLYLVKCLATYLMVVSSTKHSFNFILLHNWGKTKLRKILQWKLFLKRTRQCDLRKN